MKCIKLSTTELIEKYKNLNRVPFTVEGKADWLSEKEQKLFEQEKDLIARA